MFKLCHSDVAVQFANVYDACASVKAVDTGLVSTTNASVATWITYAVPPSEAYNTSYRHHSPFAAHNSLPDGFYHPSINAFGQSGLSAAITSPAVIVVDASPPVFDLPAFHDPLGDRVQPTHASPYTAMCVSFRVSDDVSTLGAVTVAAVELESQVAAVTASVPLIDGTAPNRFCFTSAHMATLSDNTTYALVVTAYSLCTGASRV